MLHGVECPVRVHQASRHPHRTKKTSCVRSIIVRKSIATSYYG